MKVLAHDVLLTDEQEGIPKEWVTFTDLPDLCRRSDCISDVPHTPLTRDTEKMF